ncbi:MAG: M48 family metallopeptidase [Alphaproteobacteria bacterium]|nr:M48 family metallopeptidase [Alphaproteobacteria bacterium]
MSRARYYDGVTAVAREVALRPTSHELVLFDPSDSRVIDRWPATEIALLGDLEHEAVPPIARKGSNARLIVEDEPMRRQLAGALPALRALGTPKPSAAGRVAFFAPCLAALAALFWGAIDYGAEHVAPLAPHSWQVSLGESVLNEITESEKVCRGEAGLDAINDLANRLAEVAGYPHEVVVHVVEGGPANAFALPGGVLVFYSDLIDQARDGSEVAGVLAHEIGHVVRYHSMKAIARHYGIDLLLKVVTGGYSDALNTLTSGGGLLLALRNGRAAEREADAIGVELLERLGMRADGVAGFFGRMLKDDGADAAEQAGILSSHPPTRERIEATRRPATGTPPFSDAQWRALRSVCK